MSSITSFFASKTGVFAALAAAFGLVALLHGAIRPYYTDRRERRSNRADLQITAPEIDTVAPWGNSRDLRFAVTNSGGRPAVLRTLRVRIADCEPSPNSRTTRTAAPITVYEHRVELAPGRQLVDIRKRTFGAQLKPLNFDRGETMAFMVKLVSKSSHLYRLRVEAAWYDVGAVDNERLAYTGYIDVDFPVNSITNG